MQKRKFLLDSNTCIEALRRRKSVLQQLSDELDKKSIITISTIVLAELEYGIEKSSNKKVNKAALVEFLMNVDILPFETKDAEAYAIVRANLEKRSMQIGALDTLIAAHAISRNLTIVTHNVREFIRIPQIQLADWIQ